MYLDTITIKNFRSIEESCIPLDSHLTVLVGENNGGKSNVIESLRLLFPPSSGRTDRYCEAEDVRRQSDLRQFEIFGKFSSLSANQRGLMQSVLCEATGDRAILGLTCDVTDGRSSRPAYWGGGHKTPPEIGVRELVRHVYLPPLRDAKYALASGNPTRKLALLSHIIPQDEQSAFLDALKRDERHDGLDLVKATVDQELSSLTVGVREQAAELGFSENEQLIDIARDLRFKLGDADASAQDINFSGLGFANLLYMATIVVELEKARESDLTLFLVEEPEAHLHPHLQMAVLDFLLDRARKKSTGNQGQPEGRIQVVLASHSPNLTSWVNSKNIVAMRAVSVEGFSKSVAIPLASIQITDLERRKVDRYLDVTRAALLFGGCSLLVEGIAEALLLPAIAKRMFDDQVKEIKASNNPDDVKDREIAECKNKFKRFRAATIVPIEGVDFSPYVKILLSPVEEARLADRVIVVTDSDSGAGVQRKNALEQAAGNFGAAQNLNVYLSNDTLEVDLYRDGNGEIMKCAFLNLHPRSEDKWTAIEATQDEELAGAIRKLFKDVRKGDFAQLLAEHIEDGAEFSAPRYLVNAIEATYAA